jgi:hypothetical protein
MDLKQLSEKTFPEADQTLQRYGFIKGYQEALQNIYNVEQLKECYFEQWIEEKFKIKL